MLNSFNGMPIIVSPQALEETEERLFPESQHRSARVRKKLIKRHGGEFRKVPCIFKMGGNLVMHPARFAELKNTMQEGPIGDGNNH